MNKYKDHNWNDLFLYDETSSSCLRWKTDYAWTGTYFRCKMGSEVGGLNLSKDSTESNYYKVVVNKKKYYIHRIILIMSGIDLDEKSVVNHINCQSKDNRISNLEICTVAENNRRNKGHIGGTVSTNTSGKTGVVFRRNTLKSGGVSEAYLAHYTEDFKLKTKTFKIESGDYDSAFKLASNFRDSKIQELNENGAGYFIVDLTSYKDLHEI